jgi:hypothetical protein
MSLQRNENDVLAPGSLFRWSEDGRFVVKLADLQSGMVLQVHATKRGDPFLDHRAYNTRSADEIIINAGRANMA